MVFLANTNEGSNGTAVTNANTAGPNQFNTITLSGTGSTFAFDSTRSHAGLTSLKAHFATVATQIDARWTSASITATANGYVSYYIYLTAYPTVNTRLGLWLTGAGVVSSSLILLTTGPLRTANNSGTTVATTTASVPLNTWVRIEHESTGMSGTTGTLAARFFSGGNLETNTPDTNASISNSGSAVAGATVNEMRFLASASVTQTAAWDLWWDDPQFSDTAQPGSSVGTQPIIVLAPRR